MRWRLSQPSTLFFFAMSTVFLLFDVNLLHFPGPFALTVCYARLTSSLCDIWQWEARRAVRSMGGWRGLAGR